MKKAVKPILLVLLALLLVVGGYVAYVFLDYHRVGSGPVDVRGTAADTPEMGQSIRLLSWNIGFGAYTADYDFFMDGGRQARAESPERLDENMRSIVRRLQEADADLLLLQEVDTDSTRSYHRDEAAEIVQAMGSGYASSFIQNYDSPYLFYPFYQPHGASRSGLLTFSRFGIAESRRVELPVESGFIKILDLDRCYSVHRIPVESGELYLYNLHLSAYTSDGTIATRQLRMLLEDMQSRYEAGAWCIAAGDFNKDLLGDSSVYFGAADEEYTWAQPIPDGVFDGCDIRLVAPLDEASPVPSCRNPDSAYHPGQYVLTVDGFMVSPNVSVLESEVLDFGFACSDHNPVAMRFELLAP